MSNFDDDQSEDGELAGSPVVQEDMDFSLSDDDHDAGDSLDIKPPQLTITSLHSQRSSARRGHRRSGKDDRHGKDSSRRDKKHIYRDRDKERTKRELEHKHSDRDLHKDHYRDKDFYREKNHHREKDSYREKDNYRDGKEIHKEREGYRDVDAFREKEFRSKNQREKDMHKEKEQEINRENVISRERETRHSDPEKRHRHRDMEVRESRVRHATDDSNFRHVEKENQERLTGDKELEDLRSRLLSKRKNQQQQENSSRKRDSEYVENIFTDKESSKVFRVPELDKMKQERRERLLEAEREMARRKESSRLELEARREIRRGSKRSAPSSPRLPDSRRIRTGVSPPSKPSPPTSQRQPAPIPDETVIVSDNSDVETKSDHSNQSQNSDRTASGSSSSSSSESDTEEGGSASGTDDEEQDQQKAEKDNDEHSRDEENGSSAGSPQKFQRPPSDRSTSDKSVTPTDNRSRSRSHSFSPPPKGENGGNSANEEPTKDVPGTPSPKRDDPRDSLPPYFPALQGCRSVEEFQCLNRIEEGTYGVVYRARDKTTEEIVALKRLKMEKEKEGFPITSLREINTLLKGQHPNIVTVREIVVGSNMDKIFIVMDYVEHDLKSLMETMRQRKQAFLPGEVKCLMQQLLAAVHHLHDNWILHRDLKTSNLLLSHKGILKVGDFGLAREYGSPLRNYTPVVVTLWYRAPELLLCTKKYSTPIDMWSVGCIFAEFVMMNALFPGKSEVDQLNRIFKELGTPTERVWPGWNELPAVQKMTFTTYSGGGLKTRAGPELLSDAGHSLLAGLLTYNPVTRLSADVALQHSYFTEQPLPIDPAMFPTWPAKSEGGRRAAGAPHSPKPPSGGENYKLISEFDTAMAAPPSHGFRISALTAGGGFSLKF